MDKQLGIVFTGGEGPGPQTIRRLLDDVSVPGGSSRPLIVAADSGLALAEAAGIKPDWIVGDMDSLDSGDRLAHYPKEKVILYPVDKDYTDTEIALTLLWEKGCKDTWIAGGGGGRLDHIFGIRDLFERKRYPNRWITANEDIYCVGANEDIYRVFPNDDIYRVDDGYKNNYLKLAIKPGKLVSVFTLGGGPWEADSRGLKWELGNANWKRGLFGLSNTATANVIEIGVRQGRFMVILEEGCRRL